MAEIEEIDDDVDIIPEKMKLTPAKVRDVEKNRNTILAIVITAFVLAITTYIGIKFGLSKGEIFVILSMIILIAIILWLSPISFYTKEIEEPNQVGIKEGWMVTWMDTYKAYTKAPKETTLLLVYGRYIVYDNGKIESIPNTFSLTFYKTNYIPFPFNPNIRGDWIIYQEIEKEFGEIVWADGTDRYLSAFERDIEALGVSAP